MKKDQYIGAVLIAFAALIYWQADQLPPPLLQDKLGPDALPKILAVSLGILGAIMALKSFFSRSDASPKAAKPQGNTITWWQNYRFVLFAFSMFFAYVWLMSYLGFVIASLIYLPAMMLMIGPKSAKSYMTTGLITLGVTGAVYYSFTYLLQIFLPTGKLL